jgi:hypothetical protein
LRRTDHSSRGFLPSVARRCVRSRNLENEEAKARYRAVKIQPQWGVTPGNNKHVAMQGDRKKSVGLSVGKPHVTRPQETLDVKWVTVQRNRRCSIELPAYVTKNICYFVMFLLHSSVPKGHPQ